MPQQLVTNDISHEKQANCYARVCIGQLNNTPTA